MKNSNPRRFEDREEGFRKKPKHAGNLPGIGMRIINNWSADDDYLQENDLDLEDYYETNRRFNDSTN